MKVRLSSFPYWQLCASTIPLHVMLYGVMSISFVCSILKNESEIFLKTNLPILIGYTIFWIVVFTTSYFIWRSKFPFVLAIKKHGVFIFKKRMMVGKFQLKHCTISFDYLSYWYVFYWGLSSIVEKQITHITID